MSVLEKGSTAKFIEIDQHDVVRRFILPEMEGLEGRLANFIKKYPGISLVRIGRAIVASQDEATELRDGLQGVPSAVDSSYLIDLCGDHPILGQGPARYSTELIEELAHTNVIPTQVIQTEPGQASVYDFTSQQAEMPAVGLPKPSLIASLQSQMNKQEEEKEQSLQEKLNAKLQAKQIEVARAEIEIVRTEGAAHAAPKQDYSKAFPHLGKEDSSMILEKATDINKAIEKGSKTQNDLNKAIEKARQKREQEMTSPRTQIKIMEPKPLGKIDMVLEKVSRIESILYDGLLPEDGESITGEELAEWFYQHLDTIGHEKTFAILASRLKEQ